MAANLYIHIIRPPKSSKIQERKVAEVSHKILHESCSEPRKMLLQGGGGNGAEIIDDQDHHKYTMQELYDEVTWKAGLCVAGYAVIMVLVVILRDILRVWTCFGE
jgi:hypothetical protein